MTALAGLAEERHFVFPHDFAGGSVFAHEPIALVSNEIVASRNLADEAGVTMSARVVHLEFDLVPDFALFVYLNDSSGTRFGDHGETVFHALKRMDLNALALVAVHFGGVVFPNNPLLRGHLDYLGPALLEKDVAVGQDRSVVDGSDRDLP